MPGTKTEELRSQSMNGAKEERTSGFEGSRLATGRKARSDSAARETEKMSQDKL